MSSVDVADALRTLVTQRAMRRPSSASPVVHYSEIVPEHNEESRREDWSSRIPAGPGGLDHSLPGFEQMERNLAALSEQRILTYQAIQREVVDREKWAELALVRCQEAEARCSKAERQLERYRQNERLLKATQEEIRVLWMYVDQARKENATLKESLAEKDLKIEALQAELDKGVEKEQPSGGMPKVFRQDKKQALMKNLAGPKSVERPKGRRKTAKRMSAGSAGVESASWPLKSSQGTDR